MSNTFWAVFYGATLGTFTVHLGVTLLDEWQHRKRHKRIELMLEQLEDSEYEDYED